MGWGAIVFLIAIGIVVILLEILVIPGVGIVGIIGFVSVVFGIFQAYSVYGTMAGNITLIISAFIMVLLFVMSLRSNTWKRLMLNDSIDSKMNTIDETLVKVGSEGISISRLAPSGKARIEGELYEVHTLGEFVDENTELIVVKVNRNKIIVKTKK
ncbi:MAG: NfeD family protein [Bacteroidales bacterium]|nr:NfeD family protein [Bacteroidales bacterium]MDD4575398.1 NfeD family protein [Bacteroidales bacterium]